MTVIPILLARRDSKDDSVPISPAVMKLLIALVVLFAVGFLCIGLLIFLRSYRRKMLCVEKDAPHRSSSRIIHRRRGAATAPLNLGVNEKEILVAEKEPMTPSSPVPEIRVTFADEDGEAGAQRRSRVMRLTLSEKGAVGLEPYHEEELPPYRQTDQKMESLDLEALGGLKEKQEPTKA